MPQKPQYILGLACFYHDSSACILKDGVVVAAAQEERFTRIKQDENFPTKAVEYCLEECGITLEEVAHVAFYEKPIWKFERLLLTYIRHWPLGFRSFLKAMRTWLSKKLWMEHIIRKELGIFMPRNRTKKGTEKIMPYNGKIFYVPHHISHGASSFYVSKFESSTILTVDGVGEWSTTTLGVGNNNELTLKEEIVYPDSLGLFYSAFTYYLGFKVNSGEYKVMGLAPYGEPKYKDKIYELLEVFEDGSFHLKPQYFAYSYDLKMISKKFVNHFGAPVRNSNDDLTQYHKDLAKSLQEVTEELLMGLVNYAYKKYPHKNLCMSGGVALNCVANGKILRDGPFENLSIFPAAGDAGGSVGAALYVHHQGKGVTKRNSIEHVYLGPAFREKDIERFLQHNGIKFDKLDSEKALQKKVASYLEQDKVIGHFHGRMEFGPRALGNRSIIADPRQEENWKRVNLKIKFRESFRPFAPSVLAEEANEIFDLRGKESPYMLLTTQTKVKDLPAITHKDGSARIQTVSAKTNPRYHGLISEFKNLTGCNTVINTSFNVRGEPIVCHFEEAFKCFIRTDMDILVLENCIVDSQDIDKEKLKQHFVLEQFEED